MTKSTKRIKKRSEGVRIATAMIMAIATTAFIILALHAVWHALHFFMWLAGKEAIALIGGLLLFGLCYYFYREVGEQYADKQDDL